jgi:hypothetical protein
MSLVDWGSYYPVEEILPLDREPKIEQMLRKLSNHSTA